MVCNLAAGGRHAGCIRAPRQEQAPSTTRLTPVQHTGRWPAATTAIEPPPISQLSTRLSDSTPPRRSGATTVSHGMVTLRNLLELDSRAQKCVGCAEEHHQTAGTRTGKPSPHVAQAMSTGAAPQCRPPVCSATSPLEQHGVNRRRSTGSRRGSSPAASSWPNRRTAHRDHAEATVPKTSPPAPMTVCWATRPPRVRRHDLVDVPVDIRSSGRCATGRERSSAHYHHCRGPAATSVPVGRNMPLHCGDQHTR